MYFHLYRCSSIRFTENHIRRWKVRNPISNKMLNSKHLHWNSIASCAKWHPGHTSHPCSSLEVPTVDLSWQCGPIVFSSVQTQRNCFLQRVVQRHVVCCRIPLYVVDLNNLFMCRISTATGSTAAMKSAGGQPMDSWSPDLQYMIREQILEETSSSEVVKLSNGGMICPSDMLLLRWNSQHGSVFVDGSHFKVSFFTILLFKAYCFYFQSFSIV